MKKPRNKYFIILAAGFVLWFAETAYFGFNAKPESTKEAFFDTVAVLMMLYGAVGDLLRNVRITKSDHHVHNQYIRTKSVTVAGHGQKVNYSHNVRINALPKNYGTEETSHEQ